MKLAAALLALSLASSPVLANDRGEIPDEPETTTVVVTERGSPFWAGVAVSTAVVSIGLAASSLYYTAKWRGEIDQIRAEKPGSDVITQNDCGREDVSDKNGVFTSVCATRDRARTLMLVGLATVPIAVVTAYLGFVRVTKREVRTIALVPTVTTQTAGLTLDVRW